MQKLEADLQQLLNGTQTELCRNAERVRRGTAAQLQAEIVPKLQAWLKVYEQVAAAKAAYGQALQVLQGIAEEAHAFKVAYGQALRPILGKASPRLTSFGISAVARKTHHRRDAASGARRSGWPPARRGARSASGRSCASRSRCRGG